MPKKRKSDKQPSHRKGLSGNPERRAAQLQPAVDTREKREMLLQLAHVMAGGAEPAPWWDDSHAHVLARARALSWPSDPGDIEELTCQVVGDEFYDRLQVHTEGFHIPAWLRALARETGKAAREAVAAGSEAWPRLWALQRGLALIIPSDPPPEIAVELFPDIEDPLEVARAEVGKTSAMLDGHKPDLVAQPAGEPLITRDVYGGRFLITTPFGYPDGDHVPVDHWYAWDIDTCWLGMVLNAGTFGSPEDALEEWREAVGPTAAHSALAPCPQDLMTELLRPVLQTGPLANMLQGGEPQALIREHFRLRRRAHEIAILPDSDAPVAIEPDRMVDEFSRWYESRHGDAMREAAELIADEWGPHRSPDERTFHVCSPHRISQTAILIRDQYYAETANPALALLPEWTQWCLDSIGLTGPAAERALQTATTEAGHLVDEAARKPTRREHHNAPFRTQE